jgi:hypothetical protein
MNNKTKNSTEPKAAPAYQNRVNLIGYLGRAPEQLEGRAVLSLATKVSWKPKDSDEWQSRSDWHRIVAWDKLAEAVRSLAKGDHVMVEGELRSSEWNDLYRVDDGNLRARQGARLGSPRALGAKTGSQKEDCQGGIHCGLTAVRRPRFRSRSRGFLYPASPRNPFPSPTSVCGRRRRQGSSMNAQTTRALDRAGRTRRSPMS